MRHTDRQKKPYTIGHAAKVTGVSISTLRSWEDAGLLRPHKSESGHRTFSASDMDRIRTVDQLRRVSGLNLSNIRRTLEEKDGHESVPMKVDVGAHDRQKVDYGKVGELVRDMRRAADISLKELSLRTNIGASHLSMFERGLAFLSPARLSAVAEVFDQSLVELLGGTSRDNLPIVRKGQGRIVSTFGPGVSIEQLTVAEHLMDVEVWTIEAGRESDGFYTHEGEELIFILEGELEIALAGRDPAILKSGDSAYFNSRIDHRWKNNSMKPVVALWVNTDIKRLGSMHFEKRGRSLDIGRSQGTGLGEGDLNIKLPASSETFRVVETHTAGHPTRILIEPLSHLIGENVLEKRVAFEKKYDHLRSMLLQEPRGHVGSFGLIPVQSNVADFGAFFITSYGYPKFCGHAVIGYAKALTTLGRVGNKDCFSVETPGATVEVHMPEGHDVIHVTLPPVMIAPEAMIIELGGQKIWTRFASGANCHAIVECKELGLDVNQKNLDKLLKQGMAIRKAIEEQDARLASSLDSVLFCQTICPNQERLFLAIDRNRYDRSPGVGGVAARLASLTQRGLLEPGASYDAISIFGGQLQGKIIGIAATQDGQAVFTPKISGKAHLNGISTLILEPDDPLRDGFL